MIQAKIDLSLQRYKNNGTIDSTFGTNGNFTDTIFYSVIPYCMAIQPDGKIVIGGKYKYFHDNQYNAIVLRYNTNGSIDSTLVGDYGSMGWLEPHLNYITSVAIQPDGKIVIAGLGPYIILSRFNADGSTDKAFGTVGTAGQVYHDNAFTGNVSLLIQPDGKIVVAGNTQINNTITQFGVALVRCNSDGTVETDNTTDFLHAGVTNGFPAAGASIHSPTIVLPVTLSSFTGERRKDNTNLLQWTTSSERNNNYFIIERSGNGFDYAELDRVKAMGTSSTDHDYVYIDKTPADGINYYRLRQVDFNGKYTWSNSISLNNQVNNFTVNISPIPVSDILNVLLNTGSSGTVDIQVLDVFGNVRLHYQREANEGSNEIKTDVASLPPGVYIINVSQDQQSLQRKIIKY